MSSAAVKPKACPVLIVSRLDSFHFSHVYSSKFIGTHQQSLIMEIINVKGSTKWGPEEVEQEVVKNSNVGQTERIIRVESCQK